MKIRMFVIVFLAAAIVLSTILCVCGSITSQASTTSLREVRNRDMMEYIDPDTGVHYLCWDWEYGAGMSVRYNADGTIMVTEVSE